MADVDVNRELWGSEYDWQRKGEEWSDLWGGSDMQWYGTIFPRIHPFLPVGKILEIAPGFGRWTHYLSKLAEEMVLVDLSERCIQACRERFASETHLSYFVNDGKSLEMVEHGSVDFVFSYDSLVHAELDVIKDYARQLVKILRPDGVAFFHHSNIGIYANQTAEIVQQTKDHGRAFSVTAEAVHETVQAQGLNCIGQETFQWGGQLYSDCITMFTLPGSRFSRPYVHVQNDKFMAEAGRIRELSSLYGGRSFTQRD